ncbi:MAG: hypothetical protein ACLFP2_03250 [Candidatus Woesearchaeota archaeon]
MKEKIILMAFLLVTVIGCAQEPQALPDQQDIPEQQAPEEETEEETENTEETSVATVNGNKIYPEDVAELQQMFMQQGQQISEEEAIDQLIDQMILQEKAQDYVPTTEETEQAIEGQLQQQGMTLEDYKQQMQTQGASYEEQLEQFKQDLAVQEYLQAELEGYEFNISDDEKEAYYEQYKATQNGSAPPYEELEGQITTVIEQEKQQEAQQEIIEQLREEADITRN